MRSALHVQATGKIDEGAQNSASLVQATERKAVKGDVNAKVSAPQARATERKADVGEQNSASHLQAIESKAEKDSGGCSR